MSKSTTYSLESPKDPVLPARFFTQPDKVIPLNLFVGVDMECVLGTGLWEDKSVVRAAQTAGKGTRLRKVTVDQMWTRVEAWKG